MLRLTPPGRLRFAQAPHFEITYGGAEANVAVMLAQLGAPASFVTKLPGHELAQRAIDELRGRGVDTTGIVRGGERMGVYFLEQGASQRPGKVIYDRAASALAVAEPAEFDWERIFAGAKWFHWSGITPALSASASMIVEEACMAAKRLGLTVSFDVNHRAKLWTPEAAGAALAPLMKHVDICVTTASEAAAVFAVAGEGEAEVARRLHERFGFQTIAFTSRSGDSADTTNWGAALHVGGRSYASRRHEIAIVDRVGAGDSFSGALIFALRRGDGPQQAIEFAVAASALKHTIAGDACLVSLAEVEALAAGAGGGRVQR